MGLPSPSFPLPSEKRLCDVGDFGSGATAAFPLDAIIDWKSVLNDVS